MDDYSNKDYFMIYGITKGTPTIARVDYCKYSDYNERIQYYITKYASKNLIPIVIINVWCHVENVYKRYSVCLKKYRDYVQNLDECDYYSIFS